MKTLMFSYRVILSVLFLSSSIIILNTTSISAQVILDPTDQETSAYQQNYPPDPSTDIAWSAGLSGINDVAAAFNAARVRENALLGTTLEPITLPEAEVWQAMHDGEKALWLVNEERMARGLTLLQGLEANVTAVAQTYAEWLLVNNLFDHEADGRSPWDRLDDNPTIGTCRDFLGIAENLYFIGTTASTGVPLVIEQAIYTMLYADAGSEWGHRHAILWSAYTENSGAPEGEGFMGIGRAHGGYTVLSDGVFYQNADIVVMNFFDPCATWAESSPPATSFPSPIPSSTPLSTPSSTPLPTLSPTATAEPLPTATPSPPMADRALSGRVTVAATNASDTQRVAGLAGVTITTNSGQSIYTNHNGEFVLNGLLPQRYILTPSKPGHTFSPEFIEVDLRAGNRAGITFVDNGVPVATDLSYSVHLPLIRPN